ncbi:MAG: hypothetical protein IKP86_13345, partial [Anaerolineaceae bacterium]|nr:hypothetical protein [Anaerolineaceae bacterium]
RIMQYNDILTQWIQLRKGELSLHIESFPLQALFDIVAHSRRGFQMKGIELAVKPSEQWVKADRTLTLFMINTLADNARKFTAEGGSVTVYADDSDKYVEVSVEDTGIGMTEEQMEDAFRVEKKSFPEEGGDSNTQNTPIPLLKKAFDLAAQDNGWAFLGSLGHHIRQLDPGFDSRTFGYRQLSLLIQAYPDEFETKEVKGSDGTSVIYARVRN